MLAVSPALVESDLPESPSLIARAQAGDQDAFGTLCRLHGDRLVRQATLLCGERTMAEDLAQETLVQAWRSLRRFNGRCRFFTWLCAILLNRYRNSWRKQRPLAATSLRAAEPKDGQDLLSGQPDGGSRPDEAIDWAERAAFLRHCVEQLPPKHREVIHLRFYVDHSLDGIAAALGCSVGTVKSRLFHALDRLRAMNKARPQFGEQLRQ
jgi:RNA polymerase sigma-70 factor (ECF subfamily)